MTLMWRRRRIALLLGVLASAGLGACLFPSLSDLEGSATPDDAAVEAEAAATDANPADVHVDAKPGPDASTDAAGGTWCTTQGTHAFCDDFDTDATINKIFDSVLEVDGGSVSRNGIAASSPPNSVAFNVVSTGSSASAAEIKKTFIPSKGGFDCSFDVLWTTIASLGTSENMAQFALAAPAYGAYHIDLHNDGLLFYAQFTDGGLAANKIVGFAAKFAKGVWRRFDLRVDLIALTASVTVDGQAALGATQMLPSPGVIGGLDFYLGVTFPVSTDTFGFRVDNVVCDPL